MDKQGSPLVLASASPRRRDLLESAGFRFEVIPSHIPEDHRSLELPEAFARRLAREKAEDIAAGFHATHPRPIVLGADTIVVDGEDILGKPMDREDARRMLRRLSGKTHRVITGFCLVDAKGTSHPDAVTTQVTFRTQTEEEIEAYLDTLEWTDKAGAYAVQGLAAYMVRRIEGSYTNVVGLPLAEVVDALKGLMSEAEADAPAGANASPHKGPEA